MGVSMSTSMRMPVRSTRRVLAGEYLPITASSFFFLLYSIRSVSWPDVSVSGQGSEEGVAHSNTPPL